MIIDFGTIVTFFFGGFVGFFVGYFCCDRFNNKIIKHLMDEGPTSKELVNHKETHDQRNVD